MLAAVRDAVVRHDTSPALQQHAQEALKIFDKEMVTEIYAEDEVEDEGDEGEFEECE